MKKNEKPAKFVHLFFGSIKLLTTPSKRNVFLYNIFRDLAVSPPELYDTPSNNSSIRTPPYAYARKESLYSVISPKSRKGSLDSHLYDEIRYHQHHQEQQHQQHQVHTSSTHASPHRYQHSTTAAAYLPPQAPMLVRPSNGHVHQQQTPTSGSHISHLIIPPQNAKFLQVPHQITTRKIAHL